MTSTEEIKPATSLGGIQLPATTIPWLADGEHYVGVVLNEDGEPSHHLILLPGENEGATWKQAGEWAASIGGELPTSQEQALLYANARKHFKRDWYWSGTQSASDSTCAWCQLFGSGGQDDGRQYTELRARAVRRLSI